MLWFVAAAAMVVVQSAADAGVPSTRLLGSPGLFGGPRRLGARAWMDGRRGLRPMLTVSSRLASLGMACAAADSRLFVGIVAAPVTGDAGQGPITITPPAR